MGPAILNGKDYLQINLMIGICHELLFFGGLLYVPNLRFLFLKLCIFQRIKIRCYNID
jgi:hypothetical protein